MKQPSQMTKDELEAYAKEKHGVDLDKREKIDDLRAKVAKLDSEISDKEVDASAVPNEDAEQVKYLKHPKTGVVMVATKALLKRSDLQPCEAPKKDA
ncbi:hypothetical protein DN730_08115 [Marinomonas piezotolerans]|uniref:Uncharacterized protein n=1 Tax=Marinomonas piezotolerans TaxID=2213058 RepID=A0A370U997_9GAMM|nr:hypothetical protein [Marinomonas piezotolerans]RDL44359.1 hypothetical protein DN730_08115 [Marinomonas piezotolerans]